MNRAFVLCCKESNYVVQCVDNIKKFYPECDIFVVDSNSIDKTYFYTLSEYKNVTVLDANNTNYEYGAYLYWYIIYGHNYDQYIFMQDSIMLNSTIKELDTLQDNNVLVFNENYTGWDSGLMHRDYWYNLNPEFPKNNCNSILMTIWNSFAINNRTFEKVLHSDLFRSSTSPYNKILSCAWERVWSIIFYENNISISSIDEKQITKIFGNRQ